MKMTIQFLSFALIAAIILSSCSSSTLIQSTPSGAKIYVDGESVGTTPYRHRDSKVVGSTTTVRIEKDGYSPLYTSFSRDEEPAIGPIIGGVLVLVPFLWAMKYKPIHSYELEPISIQSQTQISTNTQQISKKSKAERLRELKQLLDEEVITKDEFDNEKKKILEENGN